MACTEDLEEGTGGVHEALTRVGYAELKELYEAYCARRGEASNTKELEDLILMIRMGYAGVSLEDVVFVPARLAKDSEALRGFGLAYAVYAPREATMRAKYLRN